MAQKHNQNETQNAPMTRLGNLQLNAQQRIIRGTAFLSTSFSANNPILQLGELGYETDTNKLKIGDGVTAWNDLAYAGGDTSASLTQFDTMPTASADNLGDIVQYVGETDANYTNGYIYQCTGAGEPVVYSWTQIDVQPAPSGLPDQTGQSGKFLTTDGTDASWSDISALPDQTGQSGKFLTTDGTDASWSDKPLVNTATGSNSLSILGKATASNYNVVIGSNAGSTSGNNSDAVYIGTNAGNGLGASKDASGSVFIGAYTGVLTSGDSPKSSIAIGPYAHVRANNAIQLSAYISGGTNADANTFKVANANGNFEIMNANGNLPADRLASTTGLADGNYRLRLTITSGVPTLSWVAE